MKHYFITEREVKLIGSPIPKPALLRSQLIVVREVTELSTDGKLENH